MICDIARSVPTQFAQCEEKCSSVQYIRAVDLPAHRGFLLGAFGYFFLLESPDKKGKHTRQRGNKDVLKFLRPYARVKLYSGGGGWGGGQGGLNLPLPVPFNPGSRPVFVAARLFAFFFISKYCATDQPQQYTNRGVCMENITRAKNVFNVK